MIECDVRTNSVGELIFNESARRKTKVKLFNGKIKRLIENQYWLITIY